MQPCPHRPPCPGCPRFGDPDLAPDARRRLEALAASVGPGPLVVHRGAATGYRTRARLMVRGRRGAPKIGLFQAGSHRIADVPRCPIHHPLVNEIAAALRAAMRAQQVEPYAEPPHRGLLRALQVVAARDAERAQIVLVGNTADAGVLRPLAEDLAGRVGARLQGLFGNGNPDRTNVILGPHWQRFAGEAELREQLGGVTVCFPPGAFGQSHMALAARLVERVHALVPDDARVTELYAGAGAIGLGLLQRARRVRFNERSDAGLAGLRAGLALRPAAERARAEIDAGPAEAALPLLEDADVVIVDPPRRGLDAALCRRLADAPPERLVYVSCGLDSFERDAAVLGAGALRLRRIEAFDLFPYTEHVETLAVFER